MYFGFGARGALHAATRALHSLFRRVHLEVLALRSYNEVRLCLPLAFEAMCLPDALCFGCCTFSACFCIAACGFWDLHSQVLTRAGRALMDSKKALCLKD